MPLIKQFLTYLDKQKFFYYKNYSMSQTTQMTLKEATRRNSLAQLTKLYQKIQYIEVLEADFPTEELEQLGIIAEYSIHPIYSSKKIFHLYQKLSNHYWANFTNLKNPNEIRLIQKRSSQSISEPSLDESTSKNIQNNELSVSLVEQSQNESIKQKNQQEQTTEAIKEEYVQIKVSKNYNEIKKIMINFEAKNFQNQNINAKIQILNSWTSVPCKLENFTPKKTGENLKKSLPVSQTQVIKMSKNVRKDSIKSQAPRSIILGKNESTQTKQMKHMLKVQAKTNFVEQKMKEESSLDILDRKSIQLTYLLNIITKQYFQDFANDILQIVKQHSQITLILCEKIIQKIKEQHNFIEIYVNLIKKLCKPRLPRVNPSINLLQDKFNLVQQNFIEFLQQSFIKLISERITPSCSNFNEYKYQKQMTGMCTFLGKLIKENILSKKIFKVCFWQIVHRYVQKVKQNPQNDIVNECLIAGVVLISDSMGSAQLSKLIQKQKPHRLGTIEQNKLQKMIMALVSPNDQDCINRQIECKSLIDCISIQDYPVILISIMQVFESKRMKLKFVLESWQQTIQNLQKCPIVQTVSIKTNQIQQSTIHEEDNELFEIKRQIREFVKQINIKQNNPMLSNKSSTSNELLRHENKIRHILSPKDVQQNQKILKLLILQFLNEFADTKDRQIIESRIQYFMHFVNSLELQSVHKQMLQIITEDQFQTLMIIQCDFPFLVEGVCRILSETARQTQISKDELLRKIQAKLNFQDDDMVDFFKKVKTQLTKVSLSQTPQD